LPVCPLVTVLAFSVKVESGIGGLILRW